MRSLLILLMFFSAYVEGGGDSNCLDREWSDIGEPLTSDRMKFDETHDDNFGDGSYSCSVYITATEANDFLERLKLAVNENDIESLKGMVWFPLNFSQEVQGQRVVIKTPEEFEEQYAEIFSSTYKEFIGCLELSNMITHPYNGFRAGYGAIWINRDAKSRSLYVTSVSRHVQSIEKWSAERCAKINGD